MAIGGTWWAALLGTGFAAGVLLTVHGLRRQPRHQRHPRHPWRDRQPSSLRIATAVGAAVVVGLVTRWPVGALLAGGAGWAVWAAVAAGRAQRAQLARLDAIAVWAETLRDTLSAAAGLEQAIIATAPLAPAAIRTETTTLAAGLKAGVPLPEGLRTFTEEVADPAADMVAAALLLAASGRAGGLADRLGAMADATREQVSARLRVAAVQAKTRTAARVIITATLVMAAVLVVFNRGFLTPYDTITGQLVLACVGAMFTGGFVWLVRLSQIKPSPRILTAASAVGRGDR